MSTYAVYVACEEPFMFGLIDDDKPNSSLIVEYEHGWHARYVLTWPKGEQPNEDNTTLVAIPLCFALKHKHVIVLSQALRDLYVDMMAERAQNN